MVSRGLLATVRLGWRDAVSAARRAPLAVVLVTVAFFALSFMPDHRGFGAAARARWLLPSLAAGLRMLVGAIVTASLAVPVYRVLLLHPRSSGKPFDTRTVARYVAWTLLLSGWSGADFTIPGGVHGPAPTIEAGVRAIVRIAMFYVGIRLMLVFPSVAVGVDRHPARTSWTLAKGSFWWLLTGSFLGELPSLVLNIGEASAVVHFQHRSLLEAFVGQPHWFFAVSGTLSLLLSTGFTARVYADWTAEGQGSALDPPRGSRPLDPVT